ncbi:hypothetical protein DXA67_08020 [Bacteroides fragilis]|nr:hypothetical protein DXB57_22350 [Bacteroides fragilis]RGX88625.1 hypothetical protein DXA67_08020 [Bacteroides fragilis]
MEVEDKWLKNTIFHHAIVLIINKLNLKRWKMEDRNAFFVGKCLFTQDCQGGRSISITSY